MRVDLARMATYVRVCRQPSKPKITVPAHLVGQEGEEAAHLYSLNDLTNLSQLKQQLTHLNAELMTHVTQDCQVRTALQTIQ